MVAMKNLLVLQYRSEGSLVKQETIRTVALQDMFVLLETRARICKPFKEPRNGFPDWWAGTTIQFVAPACQAT